jgi:hypothetical protein
MRNWEIKSRSRFCSLCQSPFEVGQVYHCLLDFSQEEPERKDFCERCWREKALSRGKKGGEKAYWKANFKRLYRPVEDEQIKKSTVQRLMDKYLASGLPEHINLCFILALFQERKKAFIPRQFTRDEAGNKVVVYEHRLSGATYVIRDPGLTLDEAETVQKQVRELMAREKKGATEKEAEFQKNHGEHRENDKTTENTE